MITHHRPGRRHWLEQTGRREVEAGGGQPLSVSESVQKAWTGTAALGERPVIEERAHGYSQDPYMVSTWWCSSSDLHLNEEKKINGTSQNTLKINKQIN